MAWGIYLLETNVSRKVWCRIELGYMNSVGAIRNQLVKSTTAKSLLKTKFDSRAVGIKNYVTLLEIVNIG